MSTAVPDADQLFQLVLIMWRLDLLVDALHIALRQIPRETRPGLVLEGHFVELYADLAIDLFQRAVFLFVAKHHAGVSGGKQRFEWAE